MHPFWNSPLFINSIGNSTDKVFVYTLSEADQNVLCVTVDPPESKLSRRFTSQQKKIKFYQDKERTDSLLR